MYRSVRFVDLLTTLSKGSLANCKLTQAVDSPAQGQHVIVQSNSTDIYVNLAIEEALLRATRFTPIKMSKKRAEEMEKSVLGPIVEPPIHSLLFLYRNSPCVVIGRNQCAWKESNARMFAETVANTPWSSIMGRPTPQTMEGRYPPVLARRISGGGAVYHDEGNACFSFLSHRDDYDPARNVKFLQDFLATGVADYKIPGCTAEGGATFSLAPVKMDDMQTSSRHDLFVAHGSPQDKKMMQKITGSAMKISRETAYHHCTMLVSSELSTIGASLRSTLVSQPKENQPSLSEADAQKPSVTKTTGVDSVRSPVTSLMNEGILKLNANDSDKTALTHLATDRELQSSLSDGFMAAAADHYCNFMDVYTATGATSTAGAAQISGGKPASREFFTVDERDGRGGQFVDNPLPNGKPAKIEHLYLSDSILQSRSWKWVFGKGPKFTTKLSVVESGAEIFLTTNVANGAVTGIVVEVPSNEELEAWLQDEVDTFLQTLSTNDGDGNKKGVEYSVSLMPPDVESAKCLKRALTSLPTCASPSAVSKEFPTGFDSPCQVLAVLDTVLREWFEKHAWY